MSRLFKFYIDVINVKYYLDNSGAVYLYKKENNVYRYKIQLNHEIVHFIKNLIIG